MARGARVDREPGSEIPAAEVESRADDEVRDLGHDLGPDEGNPMVCFRLLGHISTLLSSFFSSNTDLLLARLEQVAVMQEERLHLVDAPRRHEDEIENCKDSQLEIKGAIPDLPKGEAAEKGRKDVQVDLVPNIILPL